MSYRITESSTSSNFISRINAQRSRLSILQERMATNKRINRPSDDPAGAEAVLNLRTSQTELEQFKRSAQAVNNQLTAADDSLNGYENMLERVRTLMSQGLSDTTTQAAKNAIATELDSLKARILSVANTKYGDTYLFGGTRQDAPPFDPATGAPAGSAASPQYIQIEPGANAIPVGTTAENVFSNSTSTIFADLTAAAAALRGTGDPVADKATLNATMTRMKVYGDQASLAHAMVGANMHVTEMALDRLTNDSLAIDDRAGSIEDADFAQTAVELTDTQSALDALLQTTAAGRHSLFDYLG
jgi:flagellar hook-associated protein 3 FlgL